MLRMDRVYLLADLDCFFVEVERLHRPELRNVPVVLGGRPVQRGIVSASSYEARRFGIRSGISMAEAYKRVRDAGEAPLEEGGSIRFVHEGLHGNYSSYSRRVQDIARSMSPVFHGKSIDEFELDLTGCEKLFQRDYGGFEAFAHALRRRVREEVGLPLSAGIGPDAPGGEDGQPHAKPDGVYRVFPQEVRQFLDPCDVQDVPGIGPVGAANLRARGYSRLSQLLNLSPREIEREFGIGMLGLIESLTGLRHSDPQILFGHESGPDVSGFEPMERPQRQVKSIGHENTFSVDQRDLRSLKKMLWQLTEDACRRLRRKGLYAGHVKVRIRYRGFKTHTHGAALPHPSCADREIFDLACRLFGEADRGQPVRLLGVRLEKLTSEPLQQTLFSAEREQRYYETLDRIRDRHGKEVITSGPVVARERRALAAAADSTAGISSGFLSVRG